MNENLATQPAKPRRRWLRFSLRTFFIVVTLLCIWLGFKVNAAHRQHEAVEAILKAGGAINFDYQMVAAKTGGPINFDIDVNTIPPTPKWLQEFFGEDTFRTPIAVGYLGIVDDRPITESDLAQLSKLTELKVAFLPGRLIKTGPSEKTRPLAHRICKFLNISPKSNRFTSAMPTCREMALHTWHRYHTLPILLFDTRISTPWAWRIWAN